MSNLNGNCWLAHPERCQTAEGSGTQKCQGSGTGKRSRKLVRFLNYVCGLGISSLNLQGSRRVQTWNVEAGGAGSEVDFDQALLQTAHRHTLLQIRDSFQGVRVAGHNVEDVNDPERAHGLVHESLQMLSPKLESCLLPVLQVD